MANKDGERVQETRGDYAEMSGEDVRECGHCDDIDSQAGEDWVRGLKRF